jgi:hypothetical protein
MARNDRSAEVIQILQSLATAPGLEAFRIVARTFPRAGPAEMSAGYRESVFRFGPGEVPDEVTIPPDAEEINIGLLGALPDDRAREHVVEQVRSSIFAAAGTGVTWDFRAEFPAGVGEQRLQYQLTLFTT